MEKIIYNRDDKFDIQLDQALICERKLGDIFATGLLEKIELKSETWQWEQTGNIAIEYRCDGKPSGISTTKATCWVHELRRGDDTLVYLMFPIERVKALARQAIRRGRCRKNAGDGGRFEVALISLTEILS